MKLTLLSSLRSIAHLPASEPLDWIDNGDNRFTAHTYNHELRIKKLTPSLWQYIVVDLNWNTVATGMSASLEQAKGESEVQETLLNEWRVR